MADSLTIDTGPEDLADRHSVEELTSLLEGRTEWLARFRQDRAPKVVLDWSKKLAANARLALTIKLAELGEKEQTP